VRTIKKRGLNEKPGGCLQRGLNAGVRLSDCRLNKHRLINSLGGEVNESIGLSDDAQAAQPYKISRILRRSLLTDFDNALLKGGTFAPCQFLCRNPLDFIIGSGSHPVSFLRGRSLGGHGLLQEGLQGVDGLLQALTPGGTHDRARLAHRRRYGGERREVWGHFGEQSQAAQEGLGLVVKLVNGGEESGVRCGATLASNPRLLRRAWA
jgi:hypothetical protein